MFSDIYASETPQTKREVLNEQFSMDEEVYVEVMILNEDRKLAVDADEVIIKKLIDKDCKISIRVNDRYYSQNEYFNLLEIAGLRKHNPSNIVLQGKIKRVSQLDEQSLYNLLTEIVGTKTYEEKKKESLDILDSTVLDERKADELLEDFRAKLNDLEVDKEDFEKYELNLKSGNRIYHTLYHRKLEKKTLKMKEIEKVIDSKKDKLFQLKTEEIKEREKLEASTMAASEKENELELVERGVKEVANEVGKVGHELFVLESATHRPLEMEIDEKEVKKTINKLEKEKEKIQAEIKELHELGIQTKSELEKVKIQHEQFLMRKEKKSDKDIKKVLEAKLGMAKSSIEAKQDNLKAFQKDLKDTKKNQKELESKQKAVEEEYNGLEREISLTLGHLEEFKQKKSDVSSKLVSHTSNIGGMRQKLIELETSTLELKKKLAVGLGEINLLANLKLMEECQKRHIEAVYGFFVDMVNIEKFLHLCCDSLLRGKLFSIIVRDEEVANKLVELNRSLKGGKIVIYPLTWCQERSETREYPSNKDAIILENHVTLKDEFTEIGAENLISQLIGGNIAVETIEIGQRFAKSYDCNCVTMQGEIVYSGAFLSKLGYFNTDNQKLALYLKFSSQERDLKSEKSKLQKLESALQAEKNSEIDLNNEVQKHSFQKEALKKEMGGKTGERTGIQKAAAHLTKQSEELVIKIAQEERDIENAIKEIKLIEKSFSEGGSQAVEAFDQGKFNAVTKHMEELADKLKEHTKKAAEVQDQLLSICKQLEYNEGHLFEATHGTKELKKKEDKIAENEAKRLKVLLNMLQRSLEEKQAARESVRQQIEGLKDSASKSEEALRRRKAALDCYQQELQETNQRRFDLQIAIDGFETKVAVLNVDEEVERKELKQLQRLSDKELIGALQKLMLNKLRYTEKDKANFERLEEYFRSHNEYESELRELKQSKREFLSLLGNLL